jgi:hypothetical protein
LQSFNLINWRINPGEGFSLPFPLPMDQNRSVLGSSRSLFTLPERSKKSIEKVIDF